jgi:hypothetical protein
MIGLIIAGGLLVWATAPARQKVPPPTHPTRWPDDRRERMIKREIRHAVAGRVAGRILVAGALITLIVGFIAPPS